MRKSMTKIGIIGCGTIGFYIAKYVDSEIRDAVIYAVCDKNDSKSKDFSNQLRSRPKTLNQTELIRSVDLVIETASAGSVRRILAEAVKNKKDVMIMSTGGLLECGELIALAEKNACNIYVPSGAIAGLDGLRAFAQGKVKSVTLTTTKPPLSLKDAPYVVEKKINLENITDSVTVFEGTAEQACKYFPANVNVAATLSIAGIGKKRTKILIIADPKITENVHRVVVEGEAGRMEVLLFNKPFKANPKTSRLAAMSAISALKSIFSNLKFG